jgi:hypothetical protein
MLMAGCATLSRPTGFYIAPQAHERGYNFLTVDLPGQGLLPLAGKPFRPDMQVPLKAVVDYALSRPEVDPRRLAVSNPRRATVTGGPGGQKTLAEMGAYLQYQRILLANGSLRMR